MSMTINLQSDYCALCWLDKGRWDMGIWLSSLVRMGLNEVLYAWLGGWDEQLCACLEGEVSQKTN
jgi:hypothetical protein